MTNLIILTLLLTPTYALRFNFWHLPTDLLMIWVFCYWLIACGWLTAKKYWADFFQITKTLKSKILIFIALFLFSGFLSLLLGGITRAKLGQFLVLFLQPLSLFFLGNYLFGKNPGAKKYLLTALYLLLAISGLFAALQYFTLIGLPASYWGNSEEPKRALSFFSHPNFYALWCAPLLAFLLPDLGKKLRDFRRYWLTILAWLLGAVGLFLSLSRAGWLGLSIAVIIYLFLAADKKFRLWALTAALALLLVALSLPNFRYRLTLPLYGEKSAVSRFSLWQTGMKGISESPIFGLGLTGFSNNWLRLNTDPGLTDTHNYPHNIFLDFWVETGILGLISFVGLLWIYIVAGFKNRSDIFKFGVALFLLAIIFQGLVDNPYFKNDLAMVFWITLSL